tara:strand:+ start:4702 stop:8241 length:3540 start_codon:yes stop_codon:yes gene_type:complete
MTNRFLGFSKDSRLITVYKNEDYMYQFNNAVVGIQLSRSAKGNLNQLVGIVRYPPQDIWNKTIKRGWKYYELRSNDLFYFKEVEVWSSSKYNASIENWDANTTAFPQTDYILYYRRPFTSAISVTVDYPSKYLFYTYAQLGRVMFGQQQSGGGYKNSTAYKTSSHYLWGDEGGTNSESSSFKEYLIKLTTVNTKALGSASTTNNYSDNTTTVYGTQSRTYKISLLNNKYTVDFKEAPKLTFVRGNTYVFNLLDNTTNGNNLIITTSSIGGNNNGVFTTGVTGSGTKNVSFTVPTGTATPTVLYYQSNSNPNLGNVIFIVDNHTEVTTNTTTRSITTTTVNNYRVVYDCNRFFVTGAGTTGANGEYVKNGAEWVYNTNYKLKKNGDNWELLLNTDVLYSSSTTNPFDNTLPSVSGWTVSTGTAPSPTVTIRTPKLQYSRAIAYSERPLREGIRLYFGMTKYSDKSFLLRRKLLNTYQKAYEVNEEALFNIFKNISQYHLLKTSGDSYLNTITEVKNLADWTTITNEGGIFPTTNNNFVDYVLKNTTKTVYNDLYPLNFDVDSDATVDDLSDKARPMITSASIINYYDTKERYNVRLKFSAKISMTHVTNVITSGFRLYENTKLGRVRMQTTGTVVAITSEGDYVHTIQLTGTASQVPDITSSLVPTNGFHNYGTLLKNNNKFYKLYSISAPAANSVTGVFIGKTAPAVNSVWELIYPTDEDDFLYETKNVNNSAAATKDFSFTITPMTNMNILKKINPLTSGNIKGSPYYSLEYVINSVKDFIYGLNEDDLSSVATNDPQRVEIVSEFDHVMMRNLIGRPEVLTTTFSNNNTFTIEFGYVTNSTYYTKFFGENKNKTVLTGSPTKEQFVLKANGVIQTINTVSINAGKVQIVTTNNQTATDAFKLSYYPFNQIESFVTTSAFGANLNNQTSTVNNLNYVYNTNANGIMTNLLTTASTNSPASNQSGTSISIANGTGVASVMMTDKFKTSIKAAVVPAGSGNWNKTLDDSYILNTSERPSYKVYSVSGGTGTGMKVQLSILKTGNIAPSTLNLDTDIFVDIIDQGSGYADGDVVVLEEVTISGTRSLGNNLYLATNGTSTGVTDMIIQIVGTEFNVFSTGTGWETENGKTVTVTDGTDTDTFTLNVKKMNLTLHVPDASKNLRNGLGITAERFVDKTLTLV